MAIFDKDLVKKRFAEHLDDYDRLSVVQRNVCKHLSGVLKEIIQNNPLPDGCGYEVGAGTGFLTKYILDYYPNLKWYINDLVADTEPFINQIIEKTEAKDIHYLWGDAEKLFPRDNISLFVSCSAMQWFNSIEAYIKGLSSHIVKDGIVAFTIFGEKNFIEVRNSSGGVGLDYPTIDDVKYWGEQCGLELLVSEDYCEQIWFDTPKDVLDYIKQSGMNGNGARKWTRQDFELFCQKYDDNFRDDRGVVLTFNPLLFIFKAKEDSQN